MLRNASPVRLTIRDIPIIELAFTSHGGVTIAQIHVALWPEHTVRRGCYRCVAKLIAAGYLTAIRLPSLTGEGTGPALIRPGSASYPLLAQNFAIPVSTVRRIASLRPGYPAHHIALVDTSIAFDRAAEIHSAELSWTPEHHYRTHPVRITLPPPTPRADRAIILVPDAGFALTFQGKHQYGLIEQDMQSLSSDRLSRKIRQYLLCQHHQQLPPVFFITPTAKRVAQIQQLALAAAASLAAEASRIFVTTSDCVTPSIVLTEPIWHQLGTDTRVSLLSLSPDGS